MLQGRDMAWAAYCCVSGVFGEAMFVLGDEWHKGM